MKCSEFIKNSYLFTASESTTFIPNDVAVHIENCSPCRTVFMQQKKMLQLLQKLETPALSAEQWQTMHTSILSKIRALAEE